MEEIKVIQVVTFNVGIETYGIEIGKKQLERAQSFCRENRIELNIFRADMDMIVFDLLIQDNHGRGKESQTNQITT